jgi:uncharacterized protein YbjT (DUF2867 family)
MNKQELILVTGATGFLGTYLTRLLLDKGYRVRAIRREIPISVIFRLTATK